MRKAKTEEKRCYQLLETSPSSLIPYTSTNCKSHFYPPLKDIKDIVDEINLFQIMRYPFGEENNPSSVSGKIRKGLGVFSLRPTRIQV